MMKRFKRTVAFALVLGSLIGAQAMGFDFKNLQAAEVSKSHPAVSLQSIERSKLNPDYVSVGSRVLQANGSQLVKVGLGADLTDVGSVSLKYQLVRLGQSAGTRYQRHRKRVHNLRIHVGQGHRAWPVQPPGHRAEIGRRNSSQQCRAWSSWGRTIL